MFGPFIRSHRQTSAVSAFNLMSRARHVSLVPVQSLFRLLPRFRPDMNAGHMIRWIMPLVRPCQD